MRDECESGIEMGKEDGLMQCCTSCYDWTGYLYRKKKRGSGSRAFSEQIQHALDGRRRSPWSLTFGPCHPDPDRLS